MAHNGLTGAIDLWLLRSISLLENLLAGEAARRNSIVVVGGLMAAIYSLLQFMTAPWWGRLSDRIGRRPVLLFTSLGLACSYCLWFFSASFSFFCLARVLGGLMGGNLSVASAAMADMSPAAKRTTAMGMVGAAFGLGFLLGPVLGGLTYQWDLRDWGAQHVFGGAAFAAGLLALTSAILNLVYFQETLPHKARHKHEVPAAIWIINPLAGLTTLGGKTFRRIVVINLIYIFFFAAYEFSFSFYFALEYDLSALQIGYIFCYLGFWFVLGQGGLVRLLSRYQKPYVLLYIGLMLIPLPLGLLGFVAHFQLLLWPLLLLIPITLGSSLVLAALAGLASLAVPAAEQGHAMGILRSFGSLGRALAPLGGAPLYWFLGADGAYLLLGLALFALLCYTYLHKEWV